MTDPESGTSKTKSSDQETKLACFQVHFNKWYFSKTQEPIGYRVKLTNHPNPCSCLNKCPETGICPLLYYCTCYQYTCEKNICVHIKQINAIKDKKPLTRVQRFQMSDIDLDKVILDLELDDEIFDYSDYFTNFDNFNLHVIAQYRKYVWKGFEWMMVRHIHGLLFEEEHVERVSQNNWRVMEIINESKRVFEVTLSGLEKCVFCQPHEICTVCETCHHKYICTCADHQSGILCRHCHAVAIKTLPFGAKPGYFLKNEGLYLRDANSRLYFLNMHTRIRHNIGFNFTPSIRSSPEIESKFIIKDDNVFYLIEKVQKPLNCACNELEKCHICQICIHRYSCECLDYQNNFICVHIHATHLAIVQGQIRDRNKKMLLQNAMKNNQSIEVVDENKTTYIIPATYKEKICKLLLSIQNKLHNLIKCFQDSPSNLHESEKKSPDQSPTKYKEVFDITNEQYTVSEGSNLSTEKLEENEGQQTDAESFEPNVLIETESPSTGMIECFQDSPSNLHEYKKKSPDQSPTKYKEVCDITNEQFTVSEESNLSTEKLEENEGQQTDAESFEPNVTIETESHSTAIDSPITSSEPQPLVKIANQSTVDDEISQVINFKPFIISEEPSSSKSDCSIYPDKGKQIQESNNKKKETEIELSEENAGYLLDVIMKFKLYADTLMSILEEHAF